MSATLTLSQTTLPMKLGGEYDVVIHSGEPKYEEFLRNLMQGRITILTDDSLPSGITSIRDYLFQNNSYLETVSLTEITTIGISTFQSCAITDLYMPSLVSSGMRAFAYNSFTNVHLPSLQSIGTMMFQGCSSLQRAEFPSATEIQRQAFTGCENLDTLILAYPAVLTWTGTGMFAGTKIESGEGYIYVPADLVEDYQAASGWSDFSSQIRSIDNLEVE